MKSDIIYRYKNGLYLNITNRCPTACIFCIKFLWKSLYRGYNLLLRKEPSVKKILSLLKNTPQDYNEIVFCGYGEPTYRLDVIKAVSDFGKKNLKKIRLNTIGLGNLIHNRNIVSELANYIDAVSISLNTSDPKQYIELHRPLPQFRKKAFMAVVEFIKDCVKYITKTVVTCINNPDVDIDACKKLVTKLGARFKLRTYLKEYEDE